MNVARSKCGAGDKAIIELETNSEVSVQSCLSRMGISLLSEWDMLAFVFRHGPSLTSTEQIARLIGYESTVVDAALDRLESEKLIERVGFSSAVRLHRMLVSTDAGHRRCLQQLVRLSENRAGRILLTKILKPTRLEAGQEKRPAESGK
jgi:DNA-binding MarR family transcriptional regulator